MQGLIDDMIFPFHLLSLLIPSPNDFAEWTEAGTKKYGTTAFNAASLICAHIDSHIHTLR